jgi:hypothetical protein
MLNINKPGSSCDWTIVYATILIGLIMLGIVLHHRSNYENFFNNPIVNEDSQQPRAKTTYVGGSSSSTAGVIVGLVIIALFIAMFIFIITTAISSPEELY